MSLTISVGIVADLNRLDPDHAEHYRHTFAHACTLLAARGLPTWEEPEALDLPPSPWINAFPWSFLTSLYHVWEGLAAPTDAAQAPTAPQQHLTHSTLFLPVPFDPPICDTYTAPSYPGEEEEPQETTDVYASSYGLQRELRLLAPHLHIPLTPDGDLTDAEAQRILDTSAEDAPHPLARERVIWLALFEAARLSIRHGAAIVIE